jgi:hypothetical protein
MMPDSAEDFEKRLRNLSTAKIVQGMAYRLDLLTDTTLARKKTSCLNELSKLAELRNEILCDILDALNFCMEQIKDGAKYADDFNSTAARVLLYFNTWHALFAVKVDWPSELRFPVTSGGTK